MMKKRITCLALALLLFCSTWTDAFVIARAEENYAVSGEADSQNDETAVTEETPSETPEAEISDSDEKNKEETSAENSESVTAPEDQTVPEDAPPATEEDQTGNETEQDGSKDETTDEGIPADENAELVPDNEAANESAASPSDDPSAEEEHTLVYSPCGDGTHEVTCKDADCEYAAVEECSIVYSENDDVYICEKCGYIVANKEEISDEEIEFEGDEVEASSDQIEKMIQIALGEAGNGDDSSGATKYGKWCGSPTTKWCVAFVSWCANQAGFSITPNPKETGVDNVLAYFKKVNKFIDNKDNKATPQRGDIAIMSGHIGIVIGVSGNKVSTIEGNVSSSQEKNGYRVRILDGDTGKTYHSSQRYKSAFVGFGRISGEAPKPCTLTLNDVTNITETQATIKAKLNSTSYVTEAGFYIGTSTDNLSKHTEKVNNSINSAFYTLGTGKWTQPLSKGTTYYYKLYVIASGVECQSEVKSFKTKGSSASTPDNPYVKPGFDIALSKCPQTQYTLGSHITITGLVTSNNKLKSITTMVRKKDGSAVSEVKDITINNSNFPHQKCL